MKERPLISSHAITRFQERVNPTATRVAALDTILEIAASARSRSRPRRWTKISVRPGSQYLYSATHPGVCLVLQDNAVVTVFSRAVCRAWRAAVPWRATPDRLLANLRTEGDAA